MELTALLVFGLFALCMAVVLLRGANTYQTLIRRADMAHSHRVAVRYFTTRLHQAPSAWVEDFCGLQALCIREETDGKTYITRVYCYDHTIRELYSAENARVSPEDGEVVLEAERLAFVRDDGLLTVEITHPDGQSQRMLLAWPEWKEGAP